jgi:hypothetical protein
VSGHLDYAIGAVGLAVAAADAAIPDKYFTLSRTMDCIRRTVDHALGVLAMAAGSRHMQVFKSLPGFPIQARVSIMQLSAGALAVVALNAPGIVNQEDIGGFTRSLFNEEAHQLTVATNT